MFCRYFEYFLKLLLQSILFLQSFVHRDGNSHQTERLSKKGEDFTFANIGTWWNVERNLGRLNKVEFVAHVSDRILHFLYQRQKLSLVVLSIKEQAKMHWAEYLILLSYWNKRSDFEWWWSKPSIHYDIWFYTFLNLLSRRDGT